MNKIYEEIKRLEEAEKKILPKLNTDCLLLITNYDESEESIAYSMYLMIHDYIVRLKKFEFYHLSRALEADKDILDIAYTLGEMVKNNFFEGNELAYKYVAYSLQEVKAIHNLLIKLQQEMIKDLK